MSFFQAQDGFGNPIPAVTPTTTTTVTLDATNQTVIAADNTKDRLFRLEDDTTAFVSIGLSPDSTSATKRFRLVAELPEYVFLPAGYAIHATEGTAAAGGAFYATECE